MNIFQIAWRPKTRLAWSSWQFDEDRPAAVTSRSWRFSQIQSAMHTLHLTEASGMPTNSRFSWGWGMESGVSHMRETPLPEQRCE